MILSINPWYYCNFRCKFCYLTPEQLSDNKLLSLDRLNEMIYEVLSYEPIEKVDLYGGELGLLPKDYWNDLINTLHTYGIEDINLITNLSMINDITTDDRVYTSVSFDFNAREDHERVLRNMALLNKPFSVLMLASPDLIKQNTDEMVNILNRFKNLESVEIKPYSSNQANQLHVTYNEYEEFVKKWITNENRTFELSNISQLEDVINKTRNSYSDDHVYITPNGKFGVLEFDKDDNEFFQEYDTIDGYFTWCDTEKERTSNNSYCSSCNYNGHCLSEHIREVQSLDTGCNGFYHLINWYSISTLRG